MANNGWTPTERNSLIGTLCLTVLAIVVTVYSIDYEEYFLLAISMGAIGGLVHEFAQSGGKILFFKKAEDGYYLGSISGMVLGAVAGILVVKGQLILLDNPETYVNVYQLATDVFFAGLALKGVAEAAAGNEVSS